NRLRSIVVKGRVFTSRGKTRAYCMGWRSGGGPALAVVLPGTLLEFWRVLQVCVERDCIVIVQAANTGLTEGSTPHGDGYDREVIIINTRYLDSILLLSGASQVVAFPGATLHKLERLLGPHGREPHSVIGSSCLGASIAGGVANNSGGSLVRRGPAYTECSLYARVNADGELELVDKLGLGIRYESAEDLITALDAGVLNLEQVDQGHGIASDSMYEARLRDVEAASPARFNANGERLCEASGCAGKIAIFALRLDTFARPGRKQTFYLGTNDPRALTELRRCILTGFANLPEVAEYLHRDCFDLADEYGKDTLALIDWLGTEAMPVLFRWKRRITDILNRIGFLPDNLPDKCLHWLSRLLPDLLPKPLRQYRETYEYHLILVMSDDGIAELRNHLQSMNNGQSTESGLGYFECTGRESELALLHRFAAAGAAVRYMIIHEDKVENVLPLDIALKRNDQHWYAPLPDELADKVVTALFYGHFLCHVFHQDYLVRKGEDVKAVKQALLQWLDFRGAKYPAEHNVGHLYQAEDRQQEFYRALDPTNTFNPGIGGMSKLRHYADCHLR
ncbi:MAG TPA: D-lactate dehydrogenase, partial [Halieaceae bacterium]|nr:D-lactate dehydrogenase [Halieaceae bacterium]